ncbi:hypothetical protein NQ318_009569 [Aromia moschata]|uniref:THAP-type domain-containing protein n=1 Tax=Aromia moschata TaxID=1265417 RepID=A0AAV8X9L0_9CUCU|nr:hypothetical protein NQ318_009569 [Aromia moschata]
MPGVRCAVYGCNHSREVTRINSPNIIYHSFPKQKDFVSKTVLEEWIKCCKRGDQFNPRTSVICSVHFTQNDYKRDLRNELLVKKITFGLCCYLFFPYHPIPNPNTLNIHISELLRSADFHISELSSPRDYRTAGACAKGFSGSF